MDNTASATQTRSELQEIEAVAVELATLAGAEIARTFGSILTVRYKSKREGGEISLRDPVSEVDGRIETLIRGRIRAMFTLAIFRCIKIELCS
jgi:myo-inositol-1(or 4)-monophosphatase